MTIEPDRIARLIQIAREGCYQVLEAEGVTIIATPELGRLGRRAGYRADQKYGNLAPASDDLSPADSIAEIDADLARDGWTRIGAHCSVGRRSVWMRLTHRPENLTPEQIARREAAGLPTDVPLVSTAETVERIELRGGREGDDFELTITPDNPQFAALLDLVNLLAWCVET